MEDIRNRFSAQIAARFSAAPESAAKAELIEELSDNLCLRYQEHIAEGLVEEAAFTAALDSLGDVTELVNYLNSLSSDQEKCADPFDELVKDLEDITQNVFTKAKSAIRDAERRLREEGFFNYSSPGGHVKVHANLGQNGRRDHPYKSSAAAHQDGWQQNREGVSPETPFPANELRGVDVRIVNGDVTVSFSQPENGNVLFTGNVEELEVSRTADGVLLIRQGRTASSSSLFLRGLSSSDVELCLPCRDWEFIQINTANGDVDLSGDCHVDSVSAKIANGDITGQLDNCGSLILVSASGDIEWTGSAESACIDSASGDLVLDGSFGSLTASSISGDIETSGDLREVRCSSLSGDIRLESGSLPTAMSLSSKSGDCSLRLPAQPFSARVSTLSGDVDCVYPLQRVPGGYICGTGSGPEYAVSTVSGDVSIEQY